MQSGRGKTKDWILRYITKDSNVNPLMGWESTDDMMGEVVLKFSSKEQAIEYAKKNNINFEIIEPKKNNYILKSYADNFLKD